MRRLALLLAVLVAVPGHASAHPHVYVYAKAGFVMDEGGLLTGLRMSWTYDAFTSLFLLDVMDLDRDGDGALTAEEYAAILRAETEWAEGAPGDIYLEVEGAVQPHLAPVEAQAGYADGQISVAFTLPLETPVDPAGQSVVLMNYDPSYYYAYTIGELLGSLPDTCTADIYFFDPGTAPSDLLVALGSLSREERPERPGIGRLFTDEVVLSCR